ncbi:probable LRR receptor-like serine/threonine-protein kinase At2g16250 [Lotus japonicus]|uniref:probable LRR receptor-like serine/threonine-protein kinase At2g16250 n=1 Tax=Lotus japonicus TaxID=34305 RepID=UPI00258463B7|nr:probable LRR receptor-like serine/threonine-protein kinase At2g16250 [Lotus japonicus]
MVGPHHAFLVGLFVFWCTLVVAVARPLRSGAPLRSSTEQEALLQLSDSLGLRSKDWPRMSDPCMTWSGIVCKNGRVVSINISGLRRTTPERSHHRQFAMEALANFTLLKAFNASGFLLPGPMTKWFGFNLPALKVFDLRSCSITGSIPDSLGQLSSLVILDISNNSLSGPIPPSIGNLLVLKYLNVSNNHLEYFTLELWSLPTLAVLDLSCNQFTGVIVDFSWAVNSSSVQKLDISQNIFYGGIPRLKWFRSLNLSHNYLQGKLPNPLANLVAEKNCLPKVPGQRSSRECDMFYHNRGLKFVGGIGHTSNNIKEIVLVSFSGVLCTVAVLVFVAVLFLSKDSSQSVGNIGLGVTFTYNQLLQATGDFNDAKLIKHGHTGDLFNGFLECGTHVVIKRTGTYSTKTDAYLSELDFFNKVSHKRFVPLLGHCLENENHKLLVYKQMPYGNMSDCLLQLDWITRFKIATGVAEALTHLHHECIPPIVHRDIQLSSILLDDNYEARLGSLSEACAQEGETLSGSSEQGKSGLLTTVCAYDVHCFGKVLLELITGNIGLRASNEGDLYRCVDQILPCTLDKEAVKNFLDPTLRVDEDLLEEVWATALVAKACLNLNHSDKPRMDLVLLALQSPSKVLEFCAESASHM